MIRLSPQFARNPFGLMLAEVKPLFDVFVEAKATKAKRQLDFSYN
ncbi:hypothetical protein [Polymorphobacter arshaanensis]|nr:hypothetical protein [Polymorphobacter arshaanensis]